MVAVFQYAAIAQTSHVVDVTNNVFTPNEITISKGDTVIWTNSEGNHNVNGMQSQYPSNPESFGNEVAVGWVFSHVFTLPGEYDYQCDPHVRSNMFGKVFVLEDSTAGPDIQLVQDPVLGTILTDGTGFTLYFYTKDALPDSSLCTGSCVDFWPLFYIENPTLDEGLAMEDFGVIEHPEGGKQTTYKGWPLYYWVEDLDPGDTKGEGVSNVWFVAKPDYSIMLMDGYLIGKDGVTYNSAYDPGEEMVQYFVDAYGKALYVFVNDGYDQNTFTASDFSNNAVWPVYEEELQSVASILDASLFGSIDLFGRKQLTYNGWPLYHFGEDTQRGETTGVSVPAPGTWPVAVQDMECTCCQLLCSLKAPSGIRIFPNPASEVLHIKSEEAIATVSVYSVSGALVQMISNIQAKQQELSLHEMEAGIYIIEIQSSDQTTHVGRFVKK